MKLSLQASGAAEDGTRRADFLLQATRQPGQAVAASATYFGSPVVGDLLQLAQALEQLALLVRHHLDELREGTNEPR